MGRIETVQELWHLWNVGEHGAGNHLLHEDIRLRPATANWRTYEGYDEIAQLGTELAEQGISITSTPLAWEEMGDDVLVTGRSRITTRGHARTTTSSGSSASATTAWR